MAGVAAVIFDAGEYEYPCKLWYSIMESVSSYCTIKQWREKRNIYFPDNGAKFDIKDTKCLSGIHTSLNLAAGLLKTVIVLYENNIIHGDLNSGNILWILENGTIDKELEWLASYHYAVLGELEPFCVKLIDMGTSKVNDIEDAGLIRDSRKLYEHMKSFLYPIFTEQKVKFADWFRFDLLEVDGCSEVGIDRIVGIKENESVYLVQPQQIAGDFFRLISVLTLALGIITNHPTEKEKSIVLDMEDRNDFNVLIYKKEIEDAIKAFSFDSMSVLQKLSKTSSNGCWINWENVWNSYPFNKINSSPVLKKRK